MAEQIISIGNKVELTQIADRSNRGNEEIRTYVSQVFDIEGDVIKCAMPIYEGHLIPLELESRYEAYFYTNKGIYKAISTAIARNKEDNIYTVELQLTTELEKFQRREFYRLPCNIDVNLIKLSNKETVEFAKTGTIPQEFENEPEKGVIIDISGGGLRMVSKEKYSKGATVVVKFTISMEIGIVDMVLSGKIIVSIPNENRQNLQEQRIQFKGVKHETRELLVRYIFEQQRKIRKKERG